MPVCSERGPDVRSGICLAGYYAAVTFMDEQVGRVVDHVEDLGQTDKTIVIFHGDQYATMHMRPSLQALTTAACAAAGIWASKACGPRRHAVTAKMVMLSRFVLSV